MIVERICNWKNVFNGSAENPAWKTAFAALETLSAETPEGETRLAENDVILRVMSYDTRTTNEAVLESHEEYIDIQVALIGSERIDWFPTAGLEVKTPYAADRDVTFYRRPGDAPASVNVFPGTFVVLYPADAHMPQLMTGDAPETIKKAVVKVRASLVGANGNK